MRDEERCRSKRPDCTRGVRTCYGRKSLSHSLSPFVPHGCRGCITSQDDVNPETDPCTARRLRFSSPLTPLFSIENRSRVHTSRYAWWSPRMSLVGVALTSVLWRTVATHVVSTAPVVAHSNDTVLDRHLVALLPLDVIPQASDIVSELSVL